MTCPNSPCSQVFPVISVCVVHGNSEKSLLCIVEEYGEGEGLAGSCAVCWCKNPVFVCAQK